MVRRTRATYHNKSFRPESEFDLPDGTIVELEIFGAVTIPPSEPDPLARAAIRERLARRLSEAKLAPGSPKLTRDELHDRR